jgi:hypothetical protein
MPKKRIDCIVNNPAAPTDKAKLGYLPPEKID